MYTINQVTNILEELYRHNWDERNGGNLSYILDDEQIKELSPKFKESLKIKINYDLSILVDKYLVVTGTGKYFRNCKSDPEHNLGIIKISKSNEIVLVWGFENSGRPTSELPTHLKCHIQRLKVDPNHRLVIHCHPTNLIAMTHVHNPDSNKFTETLWKMQTESIVVFPEGVEVLPWILCGGEEIGEATAEKMKLTRSVVWSYHGLFCTGQTLDEVFGLIETIEKAAEIYMLVKENINYSITNEQLIHLANAFNITYKKGIID